MRIATGEPTPRELSLLQSIRDAIQDAYEDGWQGGFDEGFDEAKDSSEILIDEALEEGGQEERRRMFGKLNAITICLATRRDTEAYEIIEGLMDEFNMEFNGES